MLLLSSVQDVRGDDSDPFAPLHQYHGQRASRICPGDLTIRELQPMFAGIPKLLRAGPS